MFKAVCGKAERGSIPTMSEKKLIANPNLILREEFDDWAILFDPDTGNVFSVNPIGVLVWKLLDGSYGIDSILEKIHETAEEVPAEAEDHIRAFIKTAIDLGLAGYDADGG
jgi:SynChlorMet cassette protein ScmD